MSITHANTTLFSGDTHNDILPSGPFALSDSRAKFFGVIGEAEIQDQPGGRDLSCLTVFRSYATAQALKAAVDAVHALANQLTGTLTSDGNLAQSFANCTFKGAARSRIIFDAVTATYRAEVIYFWRQHKKDV